MSDSQVTLRTRKFIRNPLLGRKQMVVCVQTPRQPTKRIYTAANTAAAPERRTERTKSPKRRNILG